MIGTRASSISRFIRPRQRAAAPGLGRLLEFHEQIFRHRQLEAGMSDKAKRFWTDLENRRAAIIASRTECAHRRAVPVYRA